MTEKQARRVALVGFGLWLAAHVFWIFRTEVNWDEFALLARAHDSLVRGQLLGGGRPGLSTLLLMPIVEGCGNTVTTVLRARLLWTPFVAAILVGLWFLLTRLLRRRETAARDTLWGLALFALAPPVLHYSLQVRTDQPAIAFGLLAGLALLGSRQGPPLAALAGALFALAYASSQKLLYVGALVGLLAVAETLIADRVRWRRDGMRVALVIVAGLLSLALYRLLVSVFIEPAVPLDVGDQMSWFAYYRDRIGYLYYVVMLPGLVVPLGLSALVLLRVPAAVSAGGAGRNAALSATAVATLGIVVAAFHAGALPYFWMTLGLFPAVTVAVGLPALRDWLTPPIRKAGALAALGLLAAAAAVSAVEHSADGLRVQRETMTLVDRNFPGSREGFSTKRALFCRDGAEPFPTYFGPILHDWSPERVDEFLGEFRRRPVAFMVGSQDMEAFPEPVQRFWEEHYVPYTGALLVPGAHLAVADSAGATRPFEVIVPGEYTVRGDDPTAGITIDGDAWPAGEVRRLDSGAYVLALASGTSSALLVPPLRSPPGPTTDRFFTGH